MHSDNAWWYLLLLNLSMLLTNTKYQMCSYKLQYVRGCIRKYKCLFVPFYSFYYYPEQSVMDGTHTHTITNLQAKILNDFSTSPRPGRIRVSVLGENGRNNIHHFQGNYF